MADYKTPGVYLEEKSLLAPSAAPTATAVPAFIGYTEMVPDECINSEGKFEIVPVRISTLLDYTSKFGGSPLTEFEVHVTDGIVGRVTHPAIDLYVYYSVSLYFKNGGGPCYVVSAGTYEEAGIDSKLDKKNSLQQALDTLKKIDEPTLILLADAVALDSPDYYELCKSALAQCSELKDRFTVLDVKGNNTEEFRSSIGINDLKYGAAYYPYLKTSLNFSYEDENVAVFGVDDFYDTTAEYETDKNGIRVFYSDAQQGADLTGKKLIVKEDFVDSVGFEVGESELTIKIPSRGYGENKAGTLPSDVLTAWDKVQDKNKFNIQKAGKGTAKLEEVTADLATSSADGDDGFCLKDFKYDRTKLYNEIKTRLEKERVVMPPSSAVAGVYAKIDRDRGVWKSPANCSLVAVIEPTVKITNEGQQNLNVDPTAGKSINAIRSFTGKGNLVWGARTLAGNDNEWRYVSVTRLFNYIEDSIQKSTAFAVFEPNTPMTWLKVKTMISGFLDRLWREGALAGADRKQAFFVHVGLGETMTEQDVLEGRMKVEIGIAAVRPAEFIILKFSHKMQSS